MNEVTYRIELLDITMVRSLVWEAMESKWEQRHDRCLPYCANEDVISWSVIDLAIRKKLISNPAAGLTQYSRKISRESQEKVTEVLWELVLQGILYVVSLKDGIYNITEFGLQVLSSEKPIPHGPDRYLKYLRAEVAEIDEVILTYISEAINAYSHRLHLSATTAIGCASEKTFCY